MSTAPSTTPETKKDQGFTLIELLVVVVIIGVLAAIAIPVFLSQREKAADAGTKSDLKNAATLVETYFVDEATYAGATLTDLKESKNVTVTVESANGEGFCLKGVNADGSDDFYYDSGNGGLLDVGSTGCVSSYPVTP